MTGADLWSNLGGFFRGFRPPSDRVKLELDPILVAYSVDAARVLATNRGLRWLTTALGVFTNYDCFMENVKPDPRAKQCTHQTISEKWLPTLRKLEAWNLLEAASKIRMAYANFFIIPKEDSEGGRAIFDLAAFSRLCARPYPVNLPYIPSVLRLIGSWRMNSGFCWSADYRHWWYQNKITDERIRNFFILECAGHAFRARVYLMGHSWSAFSGHSCTLGICLGEWPQSLRHLIDWESLKGDTPPAWVLLRQNDEVVGVLLAYYDNIYLFAHDRNIVEIIRAHIIKRSKYCGAQFKVTWCPQCKETRKKMEKCIVCKAKFKEYFDIIESGGELSVDPVKQECDFLGAVVRYNGQQWVWRHKDTEAWSVLVPTEGKRKTFAHFVGLLVWDMTIALETIAEVEPALQILRKVTEGVKERKDWRETVQISKDDSEVLATMLQRAKERGEIGISRAEPVTKMYLYLATDANNENLAWVMLEKDKPIQMPSWVRGQNYDHRTAIKAHIFFKELEASTWAIEIFCDVYQNVMMYLAVDNSAVFYVLRRLFCGAPLAECYVERIKAALKKSNNGMIPILAPGKHNVADCPTRGEAFSLERLQATWCALEAERSGGARNLYDWSQKRPREMKERMGIEEAPEEILDEQYAFEGCLEEDD